MELMFYLAHCCFNVVCDGEPEIIVLDRKDKGLFYTNMEILALPNCSANGILTTPVKEWANHPHWVRVWSLLAPLGAYCCSAEILY